MITTYSVTVSWSDSLDGAYATRPAEVISLVSNHLFSNVMIKRCCGASSCGAP